MALYKFWKDRRQFQLGHCRVIVNLSATEAFYKVQPKIKDNCVCGDCHYFSEVVVDQRNKLFDLLKKMKVDLHRQPNINPDGVWCVNLEDGKKGYMGYYFVMGKLRLPTEKTKVSDDNRNPIEASFKNAEFGQGVSLTINQVNKGKFSFNFYLETDSNG